MSLMSSLTRFLRSPQGRRMAAKATSKASEYAKSPEGKKRIEQARRQLVERGGKRRPR